ncbi:hypothetical protein QYM36_017907 [Artemia franciscana]|uniref:Uncharacterized protein n=1 Tax=Artemia franciscana TaxID=6661 RepID=A0AA88HEE3_ARTSF|nr:hypothetical protein QYM36_017907 [Artemia franciscana]
MVQFQKADLVLALLKGYPLWATRIVSITSQNESLPILCRYTVFYYLSHDFQNVVKANRLSYNDNYSEASKKAKDVNHAFRECESSPDIYRQFLKKKDAKGLGADPTVIASIETSAIRNQLILAQEKVTKLKAGLVKDIEKKAYCFQSKIKAR